MARRKMADILSATLTGLILRAPPPPEGIRVASSKASSDKSRHVGKHASSCNVARILLVREAGSALRCRVPFRRGGRVEDQARKGGRQDVGQFVVGPRMARRRTPVTRERTRRARMQGCLSFGSVFFGQAKKMNERRQARNAAARRQTTSDQTWTTQGEAPPQTNNQPHTHNQRNQSAQPRPHPNGDPPMTPQPVDLLIEARWIIPVEPLGVVLEHHAVAVDNDQIIAVLPTKAARTAYAPTQTVSLPEHVLIPGLVNAHTHNPMTLLRGIADDLPLMTVLEEHIWPVEGRVMGPEFIRDGVELAVAEMLRGGTTCANENYFFPDVIAATYKRLGFRACVGLPVIEFPSPWAKTTDEYFDRALAVHDGLRGEKLLTTSFVPHAPYTVRSEERRGG